MTKLFHVIALSLTLSLAACLDPAAVFQASTASIQNPVTKDMLNTAENGAIVIFAGLKAYKKACVDLVIPQSCRGTIQTIQVYTRKLPPVLRNLRAFVKNNDQVNAVLAYNMAISLISDLKSVAAANNVQVQ